MTTQELNNTLDKALEVQRKIKALEAGELAKLKETFAEYKIKLEGDMRRAGVKEVSGDNGDVKWVDRKGAEVMDVEKLMKDLGVDSLKKYSSRKPSTSYLKFNLAPNYDKREQ